MAEKKLKAKTSVQRRVNERLAWLKEGAKARDAINEHQKLAVVALITEGATLTEIATLDGMPAVSAVYVETYRDAAFAEAIRAARAASATTIVDEAQHELRDAIESGDTDRMSVASAYHKGSLEYASKIAPREFGQLLKLAGADGGALTIQVIDYAKAGGQLVDAEASHATPAVPLQAAQSVEASESDKA